MVDNSPTEEQNLISLIFKPKNWSVKQTKVEETNSFKLFQFLKENWLYFGILVALVIIAYFNSLGNGLVSDDKLIEKEMPLFRNFGYMFNRDLFSFFRKTFLYSFLYFLSGDNVTSLVFRLPNLLFHAGNAFLIFTILSLMTKKTVAFLASVIFAVHPISTEAITWIAAGNYPQYVFFFLLSFLFYLLSLRGKKFYFLSIFFFVIAILTTNRLFLMTVFISYEFFLGNIRKNWKKLVPFSVLGFIWVGYHFFQINSVTTDLASQTYSDSGLVNPLIKIPYALATYLELIFWPMKLTFYHSDINFSLNIVVWKWFVSLTFLGLISYSYFKKRFLGFFLSLFLIGLALNLTPFKISQFMAERYLYFTQIGIIVPVSLALYKLQQSKKYWSLGYLLFFLIVLSLLVRTIVRNQDWKDTDTLMLATVKTTPQSPRAQNNVGAYYYRLGQLDKAAEHFQEAIKANHRFADAYHNLGEVYLRVQKNDEAIELNQKALEFNPSMWQAYQNLGEAYLAKGEKDKAVQALQLGLKINSRSQLMLKLLEDSR